jgi:hypothetical protein
MESDPMIHFKKDAKFPKGLQWKDCIKRAVVVKAVQMNEDFKVSTLEGEMHGFRNDYLIMGTHGELYPIKKDIFEDIYDLV